MDEQHDARALPVVHVYPEFGPEHALEIHKCWCHPGYEIEPAGMIVVHNVMN